MMNYWLYRADLQDMANEFMELFFGRQFVSPEHALAFYNKAKGKIYFKYPTIEDVDFILKIKGLDFDKYYVEAVLIND